ncbi:MAG: hypothetical protein CSB32_01675 [Desulfobacterales bacterium]|nr:MAG: hypothetical protein CSB32_01675 [Desulfobacterales bacterium]
MKKKFVAVVMVVFLSPLICSAEETGQTGDDVTMLIQSAEKNYAARKYAKAIEDLEWAKKGVINRQLDSMKSLFPAEIDGIKGVDAEGGSLLGMKGTSRKYNSTDGKSVVISFVSGQGTAVSNGLGALMKMAESLNALDGGVASKLVIEKGYKGQFVSDGEMSGTLTFTLSGGRMVTIMTKGYKGAAMAEKVARTLDLARIEDVF